MVALKAELLNKQAQVQRSRIAAGSDKIRIRPTKKAVAEPKRNAGVEKRAKLDEDQKKEDEPTLEKVYKKLSYRFP